MTIAAPYQLSGDSRLLLAEEVDWQSLAVVNLVVGRGIEPTGFAKLRNGKADAEEGHDAFIRIVVAAVDLFRRHRLLLGVALIIVGIVLGGLNVF